MEPLTGSHILGRRWIQTLSIGATTLLAAGTVASIAGAATSNPPIGAFGSVAALSATSMEVQNPNSGQTTVSWTSTTQFSKTVTEAVSAITVGDCVTVTGTDSKKSKTTVAARNISVSMPNSSGACVGTSTSGSDQPNIGIGAGGPAGAFQFRGGSGGGPPRGGEGFSKGAPPNNFRRQLADFSFASGKVTAVNGATLTISGISVSPGSFPKTSQSKSKRTPPTPKLETLKVTTSSSTPVSATQTAAATDLAVGDCVNAFGPAAANGSVTASTVRITQPVGGSCTGGFFKRTNGGGGGGGGPAFFGGGGGA